MRNLRNRDYLNARIEQCKQSAANTKDPGIRTLHLQFAKMYEKEIQRQWVEAASQADARSALGVDAIDAKSEDMDAGHGVMRTNSTR